MSNFKSILTRRQLLQTGSTCAAAGLAAPGVFAEMLETPRFTEGPFYPDKLPLDTDNDLLIINESLTPAVGEITHISGRVLNSSGNPIRNAFVEIWQVDNNAVYLHSGDKKNRANQDKNFQGYGRFLTDAKGHYYFRTIKPVPYPGRTPHIHVGVSVNGHRILTTQLFIKGHELNAKDGVLRSVRDPKAVESVMGDFKPIKDSKLGELSVDFDMVVGKTAFEGDDGKLRGGIGRPEIRRRRRPTQG
ncbi:Protocatechuate 3,4-dioxygenase beta chain [Stieleria bergensis]|uniref:Protocatechuate 3,4-dioxygenase beta chain n=1 Tax=Stieleria bergensis TaxID=2528025 RepID=A0A517SYB5_9BACT|nr:Protocatechuate 3,4-dioxygenase beta chain [Planctomycetes bacterium SV_7m_r]